MPRVSGGEARGEPGSGAARGDPRAVGQVDRASGVDGCGHRRRRVAGANPRRRRRHREHAALPGDARNRRSARLRQLGYDHAAVGRAPGRARHRRGARWRRLAAATADGAHCSAAASHGRRRDDDRRSRTYPRRAGRAAGDAASARDCQRAGARGDLPRRAGRRGRNDHRAARTDARPHRAAACLAGRGHPPRRACDNGPRPGTPPSLQPGRCRRPVERRRLGRRRDASPGRGAAAGRRLPQPDAPEVRGRPAAYGRRRRGVRGAGRRPRARGRSRGAQRATARGGQPGW